MIIAKMALPRRTFLRGLGATLALPVSRRHGARHDGAGEDARECADSLRCPVSPERHRDAQLDAGDGGGRVRAHAHIEAT